MKRYAPALLVCLLFCATSLAQESSSSAKSSGSASSANNTIPPAPPITSSSTPVELARAALAAQGGDKFKNLKSMIMFGSANLYAPNSIQAVPGKFVMVTAGDRVRVDVDASPIFKFKQIYDGQQSYKSYSSLPGVQIPPATKFGLPVLARYDQAGYTVTALPDRKKLRGFRIADIDGNATDFYINANTAQVVEYLVPYNGYTFGASNSNLKFVDGILVAFNFSWRLETPQGAFFAEYSVKDVKINQAVGDDVFVP
jgi:hypothetical protein